MRPRLFCLSDLCILMLCVFVILVLVKITHSWFCIYSNSQGLRALEQAPDCETWGKNDGPKLMMGTKSIDSLKPHIDDGKTTYQFCKDNGGPKKATVAACNSVSSDSITQTCERYEAKPTIKLLCLDLGFSSSDCDDAVKLITISKPSGKTPAEDCSWLVENQKSLCNVVDTLVVSTTCEEWSSGNDNAFIPQTIDRNRFDQSLHALAKSEAAVLEGYCKSLASMNHCDFHKSKGMCAAVTNAMNAPKCDAQLDVSVATAFCKDKGNGDPVEASYQICKGETSDVGAVTTLCNSMGLKAAARFVCGNLGYGTETCTSVANNADQILKSNCKNVNSVSLEGICQSLKPLQTQKSCADWGKVDGPGLLLGSKMIKGLTPHVKDGVTVYEHCTNVGGPKQASISACNSVKTDSLTSTCEKYGAVDAVNILCLELGFRAQDCKLVVDVSLMLICNRELLLRLSSPPLYY